MNEFVLLISNCFITFISENYPTKKNLISKILISKIKIKNQGDFTTNFAFLVYKNFDKSLNDFTSEVKEYCLKNYSSYFTKINVVNGFINFYVTNKLFDKIFENILKLKQDYGKSPLKTFKYNIEMISANPTGPLHLGHGRNAFIANAVCNILKYDGYDVSKEYYVNDGGNQINNLALTVYIHYLKIAKLLPNSFELPNECYQGKEYELLAKNIFEKYKKQFVVSTDLIQNNKINDQKINLFFRETSVNYFLNIIKEELKSLNIIIDYYNFESKFYEKKYIENVLNALKINNNTYEKDNAL